MNGGYQVVIDVTQSHESGDPDNFFTVRAAIYSASGTLIDRFGAQQGVSRNVDKAVAYALEGLAAKILGAR